MKNWQWIVLGGLCLVLSGCRTDPAQMLLERDNFQKEQEIYRLRNRVEDLEEELQCARTSGSRTATSGGRIAPHAAPRTPLPTEPEPEAGPAIETPRPSQIPPPKSQRPATEEPADVGPDGVKIAPPVIDLPKESLPKGTVPDLFREPGRRDSKPLRDRTGSSTAVPDNRAVAQITLNQSLTGGYGRGGRSSEDGLLMVLEPRDVSGKILDAPGDVSIVVIDPAVNGEAARVARWDFTAADTAEMLSGGPERGIYLTLPWPSGPPSHSKVKLYVRYATRDGRKLQVERLVSIAVPDGRSVEWTPREAGPIYQAITSPKESWRQAPQDRRPNVEPSPAAMRDTESDRTASRTSEPGSRRPVWSPDRTY